MGLVGLLVTAPASAEAPDPPDSPDPIDPVPAGPGGLDEQFLFGPVPSLVGASKYEQQASDAPATVSIITADEIASYGWRTIDEVLGAVRSFYRSDDRNYPALGVRGFSVPGDYGSRILVLVDGERWNDPIYDGAPFGRQLVPIEIIDRVEVIRGPVSALYGTNAVLGVINIVTQRGHAIDGFAIGAEGGSFGTADLSARAGARVSATWAYAVAANVFYGAGRTFDFSSVAEPSDLSGTVKGADDETAFSLSSRITHKQLTLSASFANRAKTVPTGAWGTTLGSDQTYQVDRRLVVAVAYDDHLSNGLDVTARLAFHHYGYKGVFHYREPEEAPFSDSHIIDTASAEVVRIEAGGNLFIVPQLRLATGTDVDLNLRLLQDSALASPDAEAESILSDDRPGGNVGAHVQLEWRPSAVLTVNGALRVDFRGPIGVHWSPRVAVIVQPGADTALKLIAGSAFRAPNAFELGYADGVSIKRPEGLAPETITSFEAAWEQAFGKYVRMVLDGFFYELDDLVVLTTDASDDMLVYANRGAMTAVGVEAELEVQTSALSVVASATLQRVEEGGARLPSSPLVLAKLRGVVPLVGEKLSVTAEAQYISPRRTVAGDESEPVILINLGLNSHNLLPGLRLRASFDNILDYRYGDPASEEQRTDTIPREGFGFRFSAEAHF